MLASSKNDQLKSFGPYVEEAIIHEAGHILVGRTVGFLARGLDVEVQPRPDGRGLAISNFATLAYTPRDEDIPTMDAELKAAYMLFIAGGAAANKYRGLSLAGHEADPDRVELARLTTMTLEEVASTAVDIIHRRRRHFRRLVSLTRQRFAELIYTKSNILSGRYSLLTQQDLEAVFDKD